MVMKLKQNAKALDPLRSEKQIPIKERRFFFAKTSDEEENRPFWLPKVRSLECFNILLQRIVDKAETLTLIELFMRESTGSSNYGSESG